ncbi:MAG: PEP/pyruvate-binding domain-containing protein, partial [Candidatus Omnitrophica bacterium]|nr:PEP/pyruvate-binding domain-containing protein [Candidatus Omnitrophota bacterium]
QIDDIEDYCELAESFVRQSLREQKKVVYIRFASHEQMLDISERITRYELDAYSGFESFTGRVHEIITREGEGAFYVFDCLSELLLAWASDAMIANFFMVTCPYLYELKTVAYFSIMRNSHSFKSIAKIRETTQLLMDVYRCENSYYIHPLKVWNRYSSTMFLPHQKEKDSFIPITDSVNAVNILSYIREKGSESAKRNLDYWDRLFIEAEDLIKAGYPDQKIEQTKEKLAGIMMTRNKQVLSLIRSNFSLEEIIDTKSRLIGSGFIGGKTAGMLLARKIISKKFIDWQSVSEPHDSFYVGSDIFYSYIVENMLWKIFMQQKTEQGYFSAARILKDKILYGTFSEDIMERFQQIIEYFGSSPIIVRSSSLLEDGFGNAFAGKYESVFLANQGSPEQRYIQFAEAVKKIYASTMNEDALVYRKQRGLDKLDEQMALLIQRVSGSEHKDYFFPDLAGVGLSYNTYVWNSKISPEAGLIRLVFGLGTRAVNRVEGDYPRLVALDNPQLLPYSDREDLKRFSQHDVDVINTKENILQTVSFQDAVSANTYKYLDLVAGKYQHFKRDGRNGSNQESFILTFNSLLEDGYFLDCLSKMLKYLQEEYDYPVEIEFTVNFIDKNNYRINLLQCRPLQTKGLGRRIDIPGNIEREKIFFQSRGYFLGGNVCQQIEKVIYVVPQEYNKLTLSDKYEIARIVGRLNKEIAGENKTVLLAGPGRWGTTTPSLGVPVKFAEINNIAVLAEIAFSDGSLMPELSFGTHFFQDLVETDIFYLALFPENRGVILNLGWLKSSKNIFSDILSQSSKYKEVIGVYSVKDRGLKLMSDVVSQEVKCFSD